MAVEHLFSHEPDCPYERIVDINDHVWFIENDGFRVVFHGRTTPLYRVSLKNAVELRFVAVALRHSGLATQEEVSRAFGHSVVSQYRWEQRFEENGIEGLRRRSCSGRPRKIAGSHDAVLRKWCEQGVRYTEIARRLGVDPVTVRRARKRLGLVPAIPTSELPYEQTDGTGGDGGARDSEPEVDTAVSCEQADDGREDANDRGATITSFDRNPLDRSMDRLFAMLGLLDDAEPMFVDARNVPRVGIFLAVPFLVKSGLLEVFGRIYGSIGPAFYGLRTAVVCLFFLALLRIKRPENLKEYNPEDLGRLLGLDRAPEVKTLRRKLQQLGKRGEGMNLMRALAERRVEGQPDLIGTIYLDGHVKEYHGKYEIGKTYITQRRLCAPAATDTWINDVRGDPLFVVPSDINEGLTKVLMPALAEVRKFVGRDRRITVVFDRGGWSPRLFQELIDAGFHFITYRKGSFSPVPRNQFEERTIETRTGEITYLLHDARRVRMGRIRGKREPGPKYLWLREVRRLRKDGRQTAVVTDRRDLAAESVLYRMFNRWRQENYFKYMDEEFELDALLEYGAEHLPEGLDRPNPERKKIDKELQKAKRDLKDAAQELGMDLAENQESQRRTIRGFKIANSEQLRRYKKAQAKVDELAAKKRSLPKRVSATDQMKLKREQRLVADAVKMTAYQVESDLHRLLQGSYSRNDDEGRTLLQAALQSAGRIHVTDDELRITLAPQSSPHRSRAIAELCRTLNEESVTFPGTKRRLRLAAEVPEPVKS